VAPALWIFGYGSLVWRPGFAYSEALPGFVRGWVRRFWQGSVDHRGVTERPGRVVTLIPDASEVVCWGMAYRVEPAAREEVLAGLDHREVGGFERRELEVHFRDSTRPQIRALVYVASQRNSNFLGPAPVEEIAAQVRRSHGPSGPNSEYVLRLADWLREVGAVDDHVFRVADQLRTDEPEDWA
jgi:cation transport regulator ChaC